MEPLRFAEMDRSLWAVMAGTFTLRFSTGLTGAMLRLLAAGRHVIDHARASRASRTPENCQRASAGKKLR